MVKGVAFLWPVLREEAVAQGVIAHDVLDLQESRQRDVSPSIHANTEQRPPYTRPREGLTWVSGLRRAEWDG